MAVNINIPSQVKTYANLAAFPASGAVKTIYIAEDTNKTYRWTGSVYVEISGADFSGYVPTSRTLTINGTTQDLSANRTFTIPTDLTIGTTPIASGTIGRVLFQGTGNVLQQSSSLFWDSTNERLGIGGSPAVYNLDVKGIGIYRGGLLDLQNTTGSVTLSFYPSAGNLGIINSDILRFGRISNGTVFLQGFASGNIGINTTTDAGFRLDVNGTARVQNDLTISRNQNLGTALNITNTTSGNLASAYIMLTSDASAGNSQFGKYSTTTNTFKIISPKDFFLYNSTTGGDISLLNDFATGRIKLAAGGASTAQMTLFSTGNFAINTTTDAGFRLDVNGTARVSGQLTVGNSQGVQFTSGFSGLSGNCIYSQGSATLLFINRNQITANFYNGGSDTTQCIQFGVGIGSAQPANSACALFDLVSTTKGFLPPRLTTAQKNAIVSPVAGLQVYDTTLNQMSYYNGTTWTNI